MPHIKKTMKLLFTFLILVTGIISFGQKGSGLIENILLDCLTESYKNHNVNIKEQLSKYESYLVENRFLKSTNGQSYYDFYEKIIELNDIPGTLENDNFEDLFILTPNEYYSIDCLEKLKSFDSSEIINSKNYQMTLKMQELTELKEITPRKVAEIIIEVLIPSDFDKPFYKSIALLTIANTSNIETGLIRPKETSNAIDYSKFPKVYIKANQENEIIFNDQKIGEEILRKELYEFIKQNNSNHLIEFSADRETSYSFYIKVHDIILESYLNIRNEKAQEVYGKKFMDLNDIEQREIEKIYPTNIKE